MTLIELDRAGLTYPGPRPVTALRPSFLTVQEGEYLTITGPSGSGKSTLLNVLGLLQRPTEGRYLLDGVDVGPMRERDLAGLRANSIGFVFQSFHLMPYRSSLENVMLSELYRGVSARRRRAIAEDALLKVNLGHRLEALPLTLSGGERQRVAIARALAGRPRLLLCDEPTGNLDSVTAVAILDLLDGLHAEGMTVIMITHDREVAQRGSRTVRIHDGVLSEAESGSL